MHSSRLQALFEYLLDNLFDVVTILVAGYLVIRHQITPFTPDDSAELATWILAVLGLIAVSGLWDRNRRLRRIERLSQESYDLLLHHISGNIRASDFFIDEHHPLSEDIFVHSSEIVLAGITLERTLRSFMHILQQQLMEGTTIRVVLLEPEETLLQELAKKHWATADYWRNQIQISQELLKIIAGVPGRKGEITVGYLSFIPSFGFTIIDPELSHGMCRVNVYHHKTGDINPTFEIHKKEDPEWFEFFVNQFELEWSICRTEVLPFASESVTDY